jgi:predicted amidophosphoribosyltransferase
VTVAAAQDRRVASEILSLLAPPRCGICGASCHAKRSLCRSCNAGLLAARPLVGPGPAGIDVVVSAGPHEGAVRALAASLKFGRRLPLAGRAAAAIRSAAPPELLRGRLVPVPPDPLRVRIRGFDAAEEIARSLARNTELEVEQCLEREPARRQVGRPRRTRLAEPPRVSAWRPPPRRVALVDDVWTTGATLSACAEALREAGAEYVVGLTLAHATLAKGDGQA